MTLCHSTWRNSTKLNSHYLGEKKSESNKKKFIFHFKKIKRPGIRKQTSFGNKQNRKSDFSKKRSLKIENVINAIE